MNIPELQADSHTYMQQKIAHIFHHILIKTMLTDIFFQTFVTTTHSILIHPAVFRPRVHLYTYFTSGNQNTRQVHVPLVPTVTINCVPSQLTDPVFPSRSANVTRRIKNLNKNKIPRSSFAPGIHLIYRVVPLPEQTCTLSLFKYWTKVWILYVLLRHIGSQVIMFFFVSHIHIWSLSQNLPLYLIFIISLPTTFHPSSFYLPLVFILCHYIFLKTSRNIHDDIHRMVFPVTFYYFIK